MKKSKGENTPEVDMISNLPDPILHVILSSLPTTEEVARTSILARRWRHLWTSVSSIDIDYLRVLKSPKELKVNQFERFVSRILTNKSIDLESFCLSCVFYYNLSTMWQWIDAATKRNVKILDLSFCPKDDYEDIELPHFLVTCHSLEELRLSLYSHRLVFPKVTGFRALRVLNLESCKLFNDNLVEDFLKSCPLLEDLSLVDCVTFDLEIFCISCPKLKKLRIDNRRILYSENGDYVMEGMVQCLQICCPKLVILEFVGFMAWKFISEDLDSLKKVMIHPLDTYAWADENLCEIFVASHVLNRKDLPEYLPNLKSLELTTTNDAFSMNVLIQILICSPNLESLHLIIKKGPVTEDDDDLEFWGMDDDFMFEQLKMVNMMDISAVPHHLGFIEFLLESSPVLETMTMNMTDSRLSFLNDDVLKFPRASPEAEIIFVQDQL